MRYFYTVFLCLGLCHWGFAQSFLTGKVHNKAGNDLIVSVSIQNHTQRKYDLSDEGGNFRIPAREGDLITFSSVGYKADTLMVTAVMLNEAYAVQLEQNVVALPSYRVGSLSNYQLDSIQRREDYQWVYDHGSEKFVDKERKGDGVGVSFNIFRTTSKTDRDWIMLKKRLIKEEEEHYIDYRYSRDYISRLTHLQGAALQKFMELYRPSYDYARKAANVDILVFINDSYMKFKTLPLPVGVPDGPGTKAGAAATGTGSGGAGGSDTRE